MLCGDELEHADCGAIMHLKILSLGIGVLLFQDAPLLPPSYAEENGVNGRNILV
jgi:hypothetical protein